MGCAISELTDKNADTATAPIVVNKRLIPFRIKGQGVSAASPKGTGSLVEELLCMVSVDLGARYVCTG